MTPRTRAVMVVPPLLVIAGTAVTLAVWLFQSGRETSPSTYAQMVAYWLVWIAYHLRDWEGR